ncbi:MAG TPA: ABC transporter permease [Burkholderiaceae bacterium]|nr:ABC transporter permease [Burkholderiaceae bacterium]
MEDLKPRVEPQDSPEGARAHVLGSWTAAQFADPGAHKGAAQALKARGNAAGMHWDLRALHQLDHTGAQLLWNHWGRKWPGQLDALPAQRAVLDRVAQYSVDSPLRPPVTWWQRYLALGALLLHLFKHLKGFIRLIGQLLINLVRLVRAPHEGPWRDVSGHLYNIGATALPITALVGFLIGVVLAYLTSRQLRQFGADAFIVNILGVSLVRELGPMLAAILIAGRSGSAITAQIGVMRVTDELDAMRVMGISHNYRLVMPRAMALALAMPLISVWTTSAALAGGMLAAYLAMDITPAYFMTALPNAVEIQNLTLATAKSTVFGVLIALIGCHYGLRVKPNTQSLGEGTTASVVTSITVVILVDALFAVVFKDIGI